MARAGAERRAKDVLKPLTGAERYAAVVDLAARRGFFAPSAEIYGGLAGFFDYGPMGALMLRKIQQAWLDYWTRNEGFFVVDTPTIGPEGVFRASGHLEKFTDPEVECRQCGEPYRLDQVMQDKVFVYPDRFDELHYYLTVDFDKEPQYVEAASVAKLNHREIRKQIMGSGKAVIGFKCPKCGSVEYEFVRPARLMLETSIGTQRPLVAYLRPETAQGIFWSFPALLRHNRGRVPFGVAQLGLGYRNEIAPRNALYRMREFHMAEVEVFVHPERKTWPRFKEVEAIEATFLAKDGAIHLATFGEMVRSGVVRSEAVGHFVACAYEIVRSLGMPDEKMRLRQHMPDEMAHYAEDCWDLELDTSLGWIECAGIADRGCYDLTRHQEYSGADMSVFVPYDEPRTVEVDALVPDFRALGPRFKAEAAAVGEAVKAASPSALRADGSLVVKAGGKEYTIEPALFKRQKRTEKKTGDSFVPHVVEPSFGLDRIFFALMDAAISRVEKEDEPYTILSLSPKVAPSLVCVFPLMPKDGLDDLAIKLSGELTAAGLSPSYDDAGSIGKRYARADEAGVPWCITVDYDSLKDKAATLRHRDTQVQERLPLTAILARLRELLKSPSGGA
ncbi:MAG TPA: glycine--tRNA ligase [Candidatus Thermoplasmatota archaeon]|nr:glycine--tRNA ligase [Candidatus Thermoplasmatota archaeon]